MNDLLHKKLTDRILRSAVEVHRGLGPSLQESAYEVCLADELRRDELRVATQVELPIEFKGRHIDAGYRIDVLVEETVILEIKSVERLAPIHTAQLLTYLRLSKLQVALILNFNTKLLRDGIVRKVLSDPSANSAVIPPSE